MGIPKFLNYLKKSYNSRNWYIDKKILDTNYMRFGKKTWDYLILDYQSLIYSTYEVFSSNINHFIRLINKIYISGQNNNYFTFAEKIYKAYKTYFSILTKMDFNYDNIPKFLELPYNNMEVIIDSLCQIMVEHTKNLATIHCEKYTNTFIFFDGIPSMAKIKEQVVRRVFPVLIREIRTKIMKEIDDCVEKRIREILLPDFPPTIGLDSIVVNKLREELSKINDMKLGKFYINEVTDGEAEHQIMEYLENNITKFKNRRILLASPDADLILLSLINSTKGFYIDIYRENAIGEKSFNRKQENELYHKTYDYILMENLKKELKMTEKQKILDICFSFLLLGDDFVPIIPCVNVNMVPEIISIYDSLVTKYDNFKIINNNMIDYKNLKLLFIELASKENEWMPKVVETYNSAIMKGSNKINEFNSYAKYNFIDIFSENNGNLQNFKKIYMLNNGFVLENNNYMNMLKDISITKEDGDIDKVTNYMEGCQFIFELYINNTINNYRWYYKYTSAPTLNTIVKYYDSIDLQNLQIKNKEKYLDVDGYKKYSDDYKNKLLLSIIHKIKQHTNSMMDNKRIIIKEEEKENELQKYLTYDNIKYTFVCNGEYFFNKCIELINPPNIT